MTRSIAVAAVSSLVIARTTLAQTGRSCGSGIPVSLGASVTIVQPGPTNRTLSDVLSSRVPGVSVMRSSGVAGTGSRVRVRGPSGILLPQQPLLFIDGVRADGEQQSIALDAGGQAPSRLDDLAAEQIECVVVLRGPATTARYGTDAAGGIIHVITRRTLPDSGRVHTFLVGGVADDDTDYPANFGGCTQAAAALGQCVAGPARSWSPLSAVPPFRAGSVARGGAFFKLADRPDMSLGLGAHASRETGVLANNEHTQHGVNAAAAWQSSDALRVETDLWYMGGHANLPQVGPFSLSILNSALLGSSSNDQRGGYRNLPLPILLQFGTDQDLTRLGGAFRANLRLSSRLTGRLTFGHDDSRAQDEQFDPVFRSPVPPYVDPSRILATSELHSKRTSANVFVTAGFGGPRARFTTEVGVDYLDEEQSGNVHVRDVIAPDNFESETVTSWNGTTTGLVFRQSIAAIQDRLYVEGGVRHDLLDDAFFKLANPTYPFASVAFNPLSAAREDRSLLSSLRLRAAYGENGDKRPYQPALSLAVAVPPNTSPTPAAAPVERTREVEAGFDVGVFGERGVMHATYFTRWVSDGLTPGLIPPGTGTTPVQLVSSDAEWRNHGFEVAVQARPLETPNVRADLEVNFTALENELTSLGNTPGSVGVYNRLQVGYPLFGTWAPAYTVIDQNNDGVIVPAEVVAGPPRFLGAPVPTREVGVAPTITFRRSLTLSALFDYRGGFRSINQSGRLRCNANCAALYVPGTPLDEQARAVDPNDALAGWIEDASFLKLRELTLSFAIPRGSRKGNSRVVVSARNLWTHTNYSGLDPEVSQTGQSAISQSEFFTLPVPRSYAIRLDIGW